MTWTGCVAPIERDNADHRTAEIDYEKAGTPPGHLRYLTFKFVALSRAAEVSEYLWRGPQLDDRRTIPGV